MHKIIKKINQQAYICDINTFLNVKQDIKEKQKIMKLNLCNIWLSPLFRPKSTSSSSSESTIHFSLTDREEILQGLAMVIPIPMVDTLFLQQ